jgi:aminopeptidase-like protein
MTLNLREVKSMKITLGSVEGEIRKRKTRSDKRVRSTLRISQEVDEHIKAIAYNHNVSKQVVIDKILKMVLENDNLRYRLITAFPKGSQKYTYLVQPK